MTDKKRHTYASEMVLLADSCVKGIIAIADKYGYDRSETIIDVAFLMLSAKKFVGNESLKDLTLDKTNELSQT